MATSGIPKIRESYNTGDVFSARSWRAVGRVTNSGKGIYCWFDMAYPILANGATINIGELNVFGISGVSFPNPKTVSSVSIQGNILMFVVDLTSTHTAGAIAVLEFTNTSVTLT